MKHKNSTIYAVYCSILILLGACIAVTKKNPHIYPPACVGCEDCYLICPVRGKAIEMIRGKAVINLEKCIACERCVWICSYGAVRK